MAVTSGSSWLAGSGLGSYNASRGSVEFNSIKSYVPPPPVSTSVSVPTPPIVAGIEPQAYEAILYGKDIPLFLGGKMLIGGRIIEGPFFGGTQADPTVSFVAYHAMNVLPATRVYNNETIISSARLRGQEVWNNTSGYISTDKLPSGGFDWRTGANIPFAQSTARYGVHAIAYTYGILSSWSNIPLKPFGGIVPFPSVLVEDSTFGDPADGVPREEAISSILLYMRLEAHEFEVDVSGSDPAWMVGAQTSLEDFLRQLRGMFPNYRIKHTDKIRIIEPDSFQVDANLTNSNIQRGTLKFKRTDPLIIPRQKKYRFINVERDYEMDVAVAQEDRYPTPTTDAVNSTSIELPIATTAAQAVADVHNSLYEELSVRSQMEGAVDRTLFGMEVGDGVRFADSTVIDMTARVLEAVHDFERMSVQFSAGEVINCFQGTTPGLTAFFPYASANSTVPDSTDWDLSNANSDEFTIEFSTFQTDLQDWRPLSQWAPAGQFAWRITLNSAGRTHLNISADGTADTLTAVSDVGIFTTDTWYDWRITKSASGKIRIFQDGVMVADDTPADSAIFNSTEPLTFGPHPSAQGWLDHIRIYKGVDLSSDSDSDYAPTDGLFPTTADPNFDSVVFLWECEGVVGAGGPHTTESGHTVTGGAGSYIDDTHHRDE